MAKFIINTDGASRGNPGHAAAGFIIKTIDGVIWAEDGVYLGKMTNNEAEYNAVILAFETLLKNFDHKMPAQVELLSDSNLIVSQLTGRFKIKNGRLQVLYNRAKILEEKIGQITYNYIPRASNNLADKLANFALDRHLGL